MVEKRTTTKRVLQFVGNQYLRFPGFAFFALFFRVVSIVLTVLPAVFYKDIINLLAAVEGFSSVVAQHALALLGMVFWIKVVTFVCYRAYDYCIICLEMKMQESLYGQIFGYIHRHSFQFFTDHFAGSLIAKIRKCVSSVERLTDMLAWELIPFVLNLLLIVWILWFEYRSLAIVVFISALGFSIVQYWLYRWIQPYQERANAVDSELGGVLADTLTNNQTIKFFASLEREELAFASCAKELATARRTQYFKSMWIWWFSAIFALFLELGTIYIALQLWGQGVIAIGVIVLLQTYVLRVIDQVWSIGMTFRTFFRVVVEIAEVVELLDLPHQIVDKSQKKLIVAEWSIVFDKVQFSYGKHQIFHDLSFQVKPGERVALVGASGSGKTTITKLLFRLYDIQKGNILIDGQNIEQVSQESLRSAISMIPQDPILFHRSIKENIAYGNPNASDEEIVAAAKMARCHEFIAQLKDGYDTLVGERWIKLSGGERQRIAIARAILEDRRIIVMDEATSALDSQSEYLIQQAMEVLMKDKTVIVIAHRLSTIMQMDTIFVMEQGSIVEKGSHRALLDNPHGVYTKLWTIQSGGFIG